MKDGWQALPLAETIDRVSHTRKILRRDFLERGTYPVVSQEVEFINGFWNDAADVFRVSVPLVVFGDHTRVLKYVDFDFVLGADGVKVLQPKEFLLPRFFYYQLMSLDLGSLGYSRHYRILKEQLIRFPALAEQQRIVAILDEAFAGLAMAELDAKKNLENAAGLLVGHLQSVFARPAPNWSIRRIADVADHSLGKMLDRAKNRGELRPYLRNVCVRWFDFDLSDLNEMRFLQDEAKTYTAVAGDVLVCEGGYPGRAAIWTDDRPVYFQKAVHRVRFREPDVNQWFVYYLYAQDACGALKRHFTGTGIQHFTGAALARFEMPLPPSAELRAHVARFSELHDQSSRLESIYQRKLAALDELKRSILHEAFAGNL